MFLKKSLLLVTVASLFFLGGGNCTTPPVVPPSDAKPSDPIPDPTPDPIPIPSKISFSKIPVFLKSGDKITATLKDATGKETYAWTIDGQVDANQTTNTFNIAAIDSCDKVLDIGVSATDENGNVEKASKKIKVSKTWCTYQASTDSLLSNNITKLAVAPNGRVWIGTDKGLNNFDGTIWKQVVRDDHGLISNKITALFVDQANLLFSNGSGFSQTDLSDKQKNLGYEATFSKKTGHLKGDYIYDLTVLKNGNLLVGTDAGSAEINLKTRETVNNFTGQYITAIAVNSSAQWYGTGAGYLSDGQGIWVMNESGEKYRIDGSQWSRTKSNKDVTTLALDVVDAYIGLKPNGSLGGMVRAMNLVYSDTKAPTATWKSFLVKNYPEMPGNDIRKIVVGKSKPYKRLDGEIGYRNPVWVATATGLGRFSPMISSTLNDGVWESFKKGVAGVELPSNDITDLAYDKATDTLWIGTNGGGLTRLRAGLLNK